jgi:hypothetical protein
VTIPFRLKHRVAKEPAHGIYTSGCEIITSDSFHWFYRKTLEHRKRKVFRFVFAGVPIFSLLIGVLCGTEHRNTRNTAKTTHTYNIHGKQTLLSIFINLNLNILRYTGRVPLAPYLRKKAIAS